MAKENNPLLRSDILKNIQRAKGNGITTISLAKRLDLSESLIDKIIDRLKRDGYNIIYNNSRWILDKTVPETVPISIDTVIGKPYTFGVLSDPHMVSNYCREDVCKLAYDIFAERRITDVFSAGNMIEGEFRFNKYEIKCSGVHEQCLYFANHWPKRKGITTHFITGDCYDDMTEILTKDKGFVLFKDLDKTEDVATLNPETKEFEWQKPFDYINKEYEGNMYHFKSQKIDFKVTPTHNMLFKKHLSTEYGACLAKDYFAGQNQFLRGCSWNGKNTKYIEIEDNKFEATKFMQLVGWYIAKGCIDGNSISITQCNYDNRKIIANLLTDLNFQIYTNETSIRFKSDCLSKYFKVLGIRKKKYIPDELKQYNSKLLEQLLISYWLGDGFAYGTSKACASTTSKKLASDIIEIAMKCGWAASFSAWNRVGVLKSINYVTTQSNNIEYNIHLCKNTKPHYQEQPDIVPYKGNVYCVSVPNKIILVRRFGKIAWNYNCHCGWYQSREGIQIGWYMQKVCEDIGRNDIHWLGHIEADVLINNTRVKIMHPGGGSAYALSYSTQKIVESFQGGEKPHMLIVGHYHKYDNNYVREVLCLQPGCLQDQTPFMRKKKLGAHVGFCICTIKSREDGTIGKSSIEWFPFYDKSYHIKLELNNEKNRH